MLFEQCLQKDRDKVAVQVKAVITKSNGRSLAAAVAVKEKRNQVQS